MVKHMKICQKKKKEDKHTHIYFHRLHLESWLLEEDKLIFGMENEGESTKIADGFRRKIKSLLIRDRRPRSCVPKKEARPFCSKKGRSGTMQIESKRYDRPNILNC